jgi:hypothetical protein
MYGAGRRIFRSLCCTCQGTLGVTNSLQLTGGKASAYQQTIIQKLQRQQQSHNSESDIDDFSLSSFLFDVYALDFRQEGGAFHGAMLQCQADFIHDDTDVDDGTDRMTDQTDNAVGVDDTSNVDNLRLSLVLVLALLSLFLAFF